MSNIACGYLTGYTNVMEKDESGIDRLRRRLYSRAGGDMKPSGRHNLSPFGEDVAGRWSGEKTKEGTPHARERQALLRPLLFASLIFFVASLALSAFFLFRGSNIVSSENIDIEIQGPTTVAGGEELVLQVAIVNKNSVPIKLADLLIEYPDGTRSVTDVSAALPRFRESLGTVASGEIVQRTVRAILFGPENSEQMVKVSVEYRIDGSNAIFFAEQEYPLTLTTAPVSVAVSALEEVTAGQETSFAVTISSNSATVIENVLLKAEYPFGFSFVSATPQASFGNDRWELGDIPSGGKRTVTVRGRQGGEDTDVRVFRFSAGVTGEKSLEDLATTFVTVLHPVTVKKPFLSVDLALGGEKSAEYIALRGKDIRADITWTNNLSTPIADARIEITLVGAILDKRSVSVTNGFYRSVDNTVFWDGNTTPALSLLQPGDSGRLSFSFSALPLSSGASIRNPEILLTVNAAGRRSSDSNVPEQIEATLSRTVKISSDVFLTPQALHFSGPFQNSGPMPPKAEQETTYTIVWSAGNSSNQVSNAKVSATLPPYVRWVGVISPAGADVTYNPVGGEVAWNIGDLASSGSTAPQKEIAFQIALLPSVSHIGTAPVLLNTQTLTAFDRFTNTEVRDTKGPLTTNLTADPGFTQGNDRVAP